MSDFYYEQVEAENRMREEQRARARLVVAGAAHTADDARHLMDALGLL